MALGSLQERVSQAKRQNWPLAEACLAGGFNTCLGNPNFNGPFSCSTSFNKDILPHGGDLLCLKDDQSKVWWRWIAGDEMSFLLSTVPDVPTDRLLLASPRVCWQHILTSMDDAPLFRHLHDPDPAFKYWLRNLFYLYVCVEWATVPTGNRNKWDGGLECANMLPQGYPCTQFFSSPQPTLLSPWINTDSHWFTVCHYLLIAEHTNLASLRRVTKENLDSWGFGMSLILAAVMPGT